MLQKYDSTSTKESPNLGVVYKGMSGECQLEVNTEKKVLRMTMKQVDIDGTDIDGAAEKKA